jgi:hypothetical protein
VKQFVQQAVLLVDLEAQVVHLHKALNCLSQSK